MISFDFIKILFVCFHLIKQIKSDLYGYYESAAFEDSNQETSNYNIGKDFGPCPCDLHRGLCDFDCCCDEDCNEVQKNERFNFNCNEYYHLKHINDKFKCQNLKKTNKYYQYRPHEYNVYSYHNHEDLNKYHDQIFGLMCMKYDRTGDIGEFYIAKEDKEIEDIYNSIKDLRSKEKTNEENRINEEKEKEKNGEKYSLNIKLFRSDAFGNCVIKTEKIEYFKSIENIECGMKIDKTKKTNLQLSYLETDLNNIKKNLTQFNPDIVLNYECYLLNNDKITKEEKDYTELFKDNNIVTEFNITIIYTKNEDEINRVTLNEIKVTLLFKTIPTNIQRVKQKFSVTFISSQNQEEINKSGKPGYLINKPVLFECDGKIYEKIQIQGANPNDGTCLFTKENIDNINDPFILFKVDTIYSCKIKQINIQTKSDEIIKNYKIFNNLRENNGMKIRYGQFGFITAITDQGSKTYYNSWIDLFPENVNYDNKDICDQYKNSKNYNCLPITQYLIIIFSKFGRKGSSQEYIYDMRLFTKYEPIEFNSDNPYEDNKDLELKFIVKFISLNEEQFKRNFENKNYKTSLINLPEDVKHA